MVYIADLIQVSYINYSAMVQIVLTCLRRHIMTYDFVCPFDLSIDEVFNSEPLTDGSYITLNLTGEDDKITLFRWNSKDEREDCICAIGLLPILRDLVSWSRCYSRLKKDELVEVYERTLGYLVSQIFTQGMLQHLMEALNVGSTIDLVEAMLNKGMLDWLQGL